MAEWESPVRAWWVNPPPSADRCALSCLGTQQFAITIDAGPVTVDEGHGVAADRAVRRRSFINSRQDRKFNIVFVHLYPVANGELNTTLPPGEVVSRLAFALPDGQFELPPPCMCLKYFILAFSRAHFQLQGLFGAFSAGHADERQSPIDDRRRNGTHCMAIGKFLTVWCRNVHFAIRKTVLDAELFPQALCRRTCPATGRDQQGDVRHR